MKRKVLFICKENAGRSQMAEGFAKSISPDIEVASAGTEPVRELNPTVIKAMNEVGIDITKQQPKKLTDKMIKESTTLISMGCIDQKTCVNVFDKDWQITDPKDAEIEDVRKIRDQIKKRVENMIKELE